MPVAVPCRVAGGAEGGKMHVKKGLLAFPELERF